MAQIHKIEDRDVGIFRIDFSLKSGCFNVILAPKDKLYSGTTRVHNLKTYEDVLAEIENMRKEFLHENKLIRKVIVIQLKTSESDYVSSQTSLGQLGSMDNNHDLLDGCSGFQIRWIVAEEYQTIRDLQYKIIDAHARYQEGWNGKTITSLHGHLSYLNGEFRVFDYREDLHQFLKMLDGKIRSFLEELISYFDKDGDKFIQNFEMSKLNFLPLSDT